jgi:hypothetical protein
MAHSAKYGRLLGLFVWFASASLLSPACATGSMGDLLNSRTPAPGCLTGSELAEKARSLETKFANDSDAVLREMDRAVDPTGTADPPFERYLIQKTLGGTASANISTPYRYFRALMHSALAGITSFESIETLGFIRITPGSPEVKTFVVERNGREIKPLPSGPAELRFACSVFEPSAKVVLRTALKNGVTLIHTFTAAELAGMK